ncbi:hypothetical protein M426DRAFT_44759, partial [Hypoxylon sp. CI-4A]
NGPCTKIMIERMATGRDTKNFGNVWLIDKTIDKILQRQNARLIREKATTYDSSFCLTQEDFTGSLPSKVLENSESWKKLQRMVGLKSVKSSIEFLIAQLQWNHERQHEGIPPIDTSLNRLFLGNPGTGKTTVAKLYGQILADAGVLSGSEVLVKTAADFIHSCFGKSEKITKGILNAAKGKVLVIDEAYMLGDCGNQDSPDPIRTGIVDTLVSEIQGGCSEDRCVILVGYRRQMEEMFRVTNPGLARRFPISSAFEFEDYTKEELREILELKLANQALVASDKAKDVAMEVLGRARNSASFGNAGEVDNLLDRAKLHQHKRLANMATPDVKALQILEPEDMDEDFERADRPTAAVKELFNDMVGSDALVEKLEGWQRTVKNVKVLKLGDPRDYIPFNFLFRGPPGTGKTTTARKMGKIFYDLGFLATTEVVECSATDLISKWIGDTAIKTQKVFEKALGKVLFVDEAYQLSPPTGYRTHAPEAVGEMVALLTRDDFRNKLVVILAGYEQEIDKLMATNPGLNSRFADSVNFQHLTSTQCTELLIKSIKMQIEPLPLMKTVPVAIIRNNFKELASLPFWGNARDVQTLAKTVTSKTLASE